MSLKVCWVGLILSVGFVLSKPLDEPQNDCPIEDFKEQRDFQISEFAGTWLQIASTNPMNITGVKWKLEEAPSLSIAIEYSRDIGKCESFSDYAIHPLLPGRFKVSGENGGQFAFINAKFIESETSLTDLEAKIQRMLSESRTPIAKRIPQPIRVLDSHDVIWRVLIILETDYSNALVFICSNVKENGVCYHGNSELLLLSRDKFLVDDWKKRFLANVDKPCLNGDMLLTNQNVVCESTSEDEMLAVFPADAPMNPNCPVPMCQTKCDHGYQLNSDGCQTCDCKPDPNEIDPNSVLSLVNADLNPECPIPMCANFCENGYRVNDNKCQTCDCVTQPADITPENLVTNDPNFSCPVPMCTDKCDHGYKLDEKNCQTCQCKPGPEAANLVSENPARNDLNPECPVPMCADRCEHGYKIDDNNCQTCECKPLPSTGDNQISENLLENDLNPNCPMPMCAEKCDHGYQLDSNRCQTCDCIRNPSESQIPEHLLENENEKEFICATPMCGNYCPNGYAKNSQGCETCTCVDPPEKIETGNLVKCPLIWCELSCPKGLAKDEVGCPICACRISTPCPIPFCKNFCKGGYRTDKDGCQTCECLPWKDPCIQLECNLICDNGYMRDENSCQLCKCRPYTTCPVILCAEKCPNGNIMDANGCPTCDCIEDGHQMPENLIVQPNCPNRITDVPDFDIFKLNGQWNILASRGDLPHTEGATSRLLVDPHKTIRTFFTGHRNNICLPTFLGSYIPQSDTKSFRIRYGTFKTGVVKFLYVDEDYEYILLYQCLKDVDNIEHLDSESETISSNSPDDYEDVEIDVLVNDAIENNELPKDDSWCEKPNIDILSKRRYISERVWGEVEGILLDFCLTRNDMDELDTSVYCQPELNCNINAFPSVSTLSWQAFQGTWFAVAKTDRNNYDPSEQFKFVLHEDGTITLYHTDARSNKCRGTTKAKIIPDVYNPGDLTVEFGRQTKHGKVVYTDYEVALYYECTSPQNEGPCAEEDTQLTILHRNRVVPEGLLQRFEGLVEMMCLNPSLLSMIDHNIYCPIMKGCKTEDFLGKPDLDIQKFQGRWNSILMKYNTSWDFVDMEIVPNQDNTYTMMYTGAVIYNCSDSMHATLYPVAKDPGTFRVSYGVMSGYLRVIWTDYRYALLYECHKQMPSGGCYPDSEHVMFVGRPELPLPDISDVDVDNLLAQICKEKKDFKVTFRRADCHLVKPEFVCKANGFPLHANFTLKSIVGEWYVLGHTRHRAQNMELVKLKVEKLSEEKVAFLIQQYMQKSGSCIPPTYIVGLRSQEHAAEFYSHSGKRPGLIRFGSVTNSTALLYICPKDRHHDTCQPSEMTIVLLARTPTINQQTHWNLMQKVAELCVSPCVIVPTKYNYACVIIPPYTPKCKLNNMPVMKKFDMKQFIGTWYVTSAVGRSRYGSPMVVIQAGGNDYFFATFYGTDRNGKCHFPRRAILHQRADSFEAIYDITFGKITGTLHVVYTDYENALLYECDHVDTEGRCLPTHAQAYFISRTTSLDMRLRAQLAKRFPDLCLNPYDIKEVVHEVDCTLQGYQQCRPQMPRILNYFNITQLEGQWYSLIRSSNAPTWPGGVANFTLKVDGAVDLKAVGKRFGDCLLPVGSELVAYAGQSMWIRSDGGYVQLIGADNNYIVLLQCLSSLEDCNPETAQIDLLGRSSRVSQTAWQFLENVTETLCFTKKGYMNTMQITNKKCPLKYTAKASVLSVCNHSNLDNLPKYDLKMFLGEWQTYAHLTHYPIAEAVNYRVTMEREGLLKGYNMAYREGKCLPTYPVYIKVDDTGVSHFKISKYEDFRDAFDVWLLYGSSKNLVLFECYNTFNNSCHYDDAFIEVASRTHTLSADQQGHVYDAMTSNCFEISDYISARKTDDCQLKLDDRNCSFEAVESVQEFDLRSVVGPWYRIMYTQGTEISKLTTSVTFLYRNDLQLNTLRIGKRLDGICFEEMTGPLVTINTSQPGLLRTYDGNRTALSKIIYHTEKYMILFDCLTEDPSVTTLDKCPYDNQQVNIYAKEKEVLTVDANFLVDVVFRKTCFDTRRLKEILPTDDCLVPSRLKSCRIDDIGVVVEDTSKILGTWYQLARSTSQPDVTWDSGMTIIEKMSDDQLKVLYRGRFSYNEKTCTPLISYELTQKTDDPTVFEYPAYPLSLGKGIVKIVYTDDNLLITYHCYPGGVTSQGLCARNKQNVAIYSRRRFVNSEMRDFMFGVMWSRLCMSYDEMVLTNQTRDCYIGEEYQQPFKHKSCFIRNIPVQENFDIFNFSGIWYEIEGTRNDYSLWEAVINNFEAKTQNFLTFQSSGKSNRECKGPFEAYMRPRFGAKESSDMLMWSGHVAGYGSPWSHPVSLKIVYTDYKVALLYICHDTKDDGSCATSSQQLQLISKTHNVGLLVKQFIYGIITADNSSICVDIADMVHSIKEDTCIDLAKKEHRPSSEYDQQIPDCDEFSCDLVCDMGHQINQLGCPVCACAEFNQEDTFTETSGDGEVTNSISETEATNEKDDNLKKTEDAELIEYAFGSGDMNIVSFEDIKCPPLICSLDCPNGFQKTQNGCPLCQCAEVENKISTKL